jgi:hypothetical protein
MLVRSIKLLQASATTVYLKQSACKVFNPPVAIFRQFHKSPQYFRRMAPIKLNADERLEKLDPVLQTGITLSLKYFIAKSKMLTRENPKFLPNFRPQNNIFRRKF